MTKDELPRVLQVPTITIGSMGYRYAQYPDSNGKMHVPVFSDEGKAKAWLDRGGVDLWIKQRDPREGFMSRSFIVKEIQSEEFNSSLFVGHILDFEPEFGKLFASAEHTIQL
jgi:hypothetical protein